MEATSASFNWYDMTEEDFIEALKSRNEEILSYYREWKVWQTWNMWQEPMGIIDGEITNER